MLVFFFSPPHKDNNHPNLSVARASPGIEQRQKCCFTRRHSAPQPAAWLAGDQKCLAFQFKAPGKPAPSHLNTTNRFLPARPADGDWLDTASQSYWRQMGREKKAWEKQGSTELAQVLSHFPASVWEKLTEHHRIYFSFKSWNDQRCLLFAHSGPCTVCLI